MLYIRGEGHKICGDRLEGDGARSINELQRVKSRNGMKPKHDGQNKCRRAIGYWPPHLNGNTLFAFNRYHTSMAVDITCLYKINIDTIKLPHAFSDTVEIGWIWRGEMSAH